MTTSRLLPIFTLMAVLGAPFPSIADGNEMLNDCRMLLDMDDGTLTADDAGRLDMPGASMCVGYVSGAMHFLGGWLALHPNDLPICVPNGVSRIEIVRVYVNLLQDHPKELDDAEAKLFVRALSEAFPCASR